MAIHTGGLNVLLQLGRSRPDRVCDCDSWDLLSRTDRLIISAHNRYESRLGREWTLEQDRVVHARSRDPRRNYQSSQGTRPFPRRRPIKHNWSSRRCSLLGTVTGMIDVVLMCWLTPDLRSARLMVRLFRPTIANNGRYDGLHFRVFNSHCYAASGRARNAGLPMNSYVRPRPLN